MAEGKARIRLMIYDGSRQAFSEKHDVLLRVHNGQTTDSVTKTLNMQAADEGVVLLDVDFFDNFADNYTVVVSADDYRDAGFFPVKVFPKVLADANLMLMPKDPNRGKNSQTRASAMN